MVDIQKYLLSGQMCLYLYQFFSLLLCPDLIIFIQNIFTVYFLFLKITLKRSCCPQMCIINTEHNCIIEINKMSTAIGFLNYFHAVYVDSEKHSQLPTITYLFSQSLFLVSIHFKYIRLIFLSLFFVERLPYI